MSLFRVLASPPLSISSSLTWFKTFRRNALFGKLIGPETWRVGRLPQHSGPSRQLRAPGLGNREAGPTSGILVLRMGSVQVSVMPLAFP